MSVIIQQPMIQPQPMIIQQPAIIQPQPMFIQQPPIIQPQPMIIQQPAIIQPQPMIIQQPAIIQQTSPALVVVKSNAVGTEPTCMTCPSCQRQIVTNTSPKSGCITWLSCSVIAIFGFVAGCCLIPFCVDSLQDVRHTCPLCNMYIGTYKRM